MGFHFEPLIVWPHRAYREEKSEDFFLPVVPAPPRIPHEVVVWRPHEALRLGHTTRVEKLDIPHIAEGIGPHERAVICFTSVIVHGIFGRLEQIFAGHGHPSEIVAPPFLLYRRDDMTGPERRLDALQHQHPGTAAALDVGPRGGMDFLSSSEPFPRPDSETMAEHNRALRMSIDGLVARLQSHHFILYPPVLWATMQEVDSWFAKAADDRGPQWRHSRAHPDSAAQYQAWRSWVRALAGTEARMLFVFPLY